jgi:hypothetical protein
MDVKALSSEGKSEAIEVDKATWDDVKDGRSD